MHTSNISILSRVQAQNVPEIMSLQRLKELTDALTDRDFMLKRKQEALENILSTSPIPVFFWMADKELKFFANGGELPQAGIDQPSKYLGTSLYEYLGTADETVTPIKEIKKALKGKTVTYTFDHNGRKLWTKCSPLYDYDNKIIGVIGITWDFTLIESALELFSKAVSQKDDIPTELYSNIKTLHENIISECQLNKLG